LISSSALIMIMSSIAIPAPSASPCVCACLYTQCSLRDTTPQLLAQWNNPQQDMHTNHFACAHSPRHTLNVHVTRCARYALLPALPSSTQRRTIAPRPTCGGTRRWQARARDQINQQRRATSPPHSTARHYDHNAGTTQKAKYQGNTHPPNERARSQDTRGGGVRSLARRRSNERTSTRHVGACSKGLHAVSAFSAHQTLAAATHLQKSSQTIY
jgi:hypothetical protein